MVMNFEATDLVPITNTRVKETGLRRSRGDSVNRAWQRRAVTAALAVLMTAGCVSLPDALVQLPNSYTVYTDGNPEVCNTPDADVTQSIVRVATSDGGDASGVVVAQNRVLTAAHVVVNSRVTLVSIDESYRQADLLAIDNGADLALLAVHTGSLQPLQLAHTTLYEYEQVWAIGYPLALDQVTTHGFFRNHAHGRLFTSAPIQAGASGGGLMRCENGQFELAGLIRGYGAYRVGDELIPLHDLSIHTPAESIQRFVFLSEGTSL